MKLNLFALFAAVAVEAHFVDLNRPPTMNQDVNVVPLNSNQIPGYMATTEGWEMSANYNINAETMTITTRVGYKGAFEDGNVIQSFLQFQDWDEPWKNVNPASPADYEAEFMSVVCNLIHEQPMRPFVQMTCGTKVFQELNDFHDQ